MLTTFNRSTMPQALLTVTLVVCTLTATNPLLAAGSWDEATEVRLVVAGDIGSEPMEYRIEMFSGGDARIAIVDAAEPAARRPTIMLVAGQVMLTKNMELEEGYEIDALDGSVLMLQLALTLLAHSVEGGPDAVPSEGIDVQHDEQEEPIALSTTSAGGEFPAPWRLSGTVSRESAERITYTLDLSYTAGNREARLGMTGSWEKKATRPELDPEMKLAEWRSYLIGPIERQHEGSTIYDFGAQPKEFTAQTLGELRLEISQQ